MGVFNVQRCINKEQCVADIQQWFRDSGSVWQKFAQSLSQYEELLGAELTDALSKMCFDCPAHDDVYSARIIRDAFGEKYDTKTMIMVGSGTISQVYKVRDNSRDKFVAIKVMHPNVKREIRDACDAYNKIKDSVFVPRMLLGAALAYFFVGLKEQLEMSLEFKNGRLFKNALQPLSEAKKNGNYIFVIPEMIEYSKKCLVMDYVESTLMANLDTRCVNKEILHNVCNLIRVLTVTSSYVGVVHGDLHQGNIGVQNQDSFAGVKIVLYDFGQCYNVNKLPFETRTRMIATYLRRDIRQFIEMLPETIRNELSPKLTGDYVVDNYKLVKTMLHHMDIVEPNMYKIISSWGKTKTNSNILNAIDIDSLSYLDEHGIACYAEKYTPYDEFSYLRNFT
jgi:predicted unusual protein kinase regulating ubiquinone biosynthesis (AarF/ABC1/UbiB family)